MISSIGLKNHWAVSDYLQRSARHISSKTDLDQAYAVGKKAVEFALTGKNAVMPVIKRLSDKPYKWKVESASLSRVANVEKTLPMNFISKDGFSITRSGIRYLEPLIQGEAPIKYRRGIPEIAELKNILVSKKIF
jgi:6-phosphofructokinase 1